MKRNEKPKGGDKKLEDAWKKEGVIGSESGKPKERWKAERINGLDGIK
jgi:hypothetical protein